MQQNTAFLAETPPEGIEVSNGQNGPNDAEAQPTAQVIQEQDFSKNSSGQAKQSATHFQDDLSLPEEVRNQLKQDAKPFALTNFFIKYPCLCIISQLTLLIGLTALAQSLGYFELTAQNNREYLIWSDDRAIAWDKQIVAEEFLLANSGGEGDQPLRMTSVRAWNPMILYETKIGGNLLLKQNILKIYEIENNIKDLEQWPNVCLASSVDDTTCSTKSWISPLLFLQLGGETGNIPDLTQDQIDAAWNNCYTSQDVWDDYVQPLVQDKKLIEEQGGRVEFMRSFSEFGLPLKIGDTRYKSLTDRKLEQKDYIGTFQKQILKQFEKYEKGNDGIYPQIVSEAVTEETFNELVTQDTNWAAASVLFVFIYFNIHLQSLFLASMGILIILLSFGLTAVINEGIIRNTFYSSLHSLVIFIVLGIAADDIFVFIDAWRQSANIRMISDDIQKRLAYSFRRAARATAITSSTTSVAFLANAFSPIMPIASFGIYAAVIISANYLMIIMIFPPLIIFWEANLSNRNWCCCKRNQDETAGDDIIKAEQDVNRAERFFDESWNKTVKTYAWPIIIAFFIWTIIASIFAFQLSPLTKEEEFLPADHEMTLVWDSVAKNFPSGAIIELNVDIFWGVKDIDKEKVNKWDPFYVGEVIWDDSFDLSIEANQQNLLDFCTDLVNQDFVADKYVVCWTDAFNIYLGQQSPPLAMPLPPDTFNEQIKAWTNTDTGGQLAKSQQTLGFKNEKLIYTKIYSKSKGLAYDAYENKNPWYEKWENHMVEYRASAPDGMKSAVQTAGQLWAWLPTERAFMSSAFKGMTIATVFAFIILLVATGNIIQSILSLLCVAIVIVSVLAIMQLQGWEIGISESIAMVILIGFSVDYVVHLSADYMHSAHSSRNDKMQQAYKEMGVSILSGSITTFGSGVFLFGGKIITFNKFAVLITSTISLSFIVAMLLFGALMHVIGPQDDFGNCYKKKSPKTTDKTTRVANHELPSKKSATDEKDLVIESY